MADASEAPETLETLQARHRKEQRDLVSRITQKKKQASKKTRKGVNDECERLEQELKERQARELATFNGENPHEEPALEEEQDIAEVEEGQVNGVAMAVENLTIDSGREQKHTTEQNGPKKKKNRAKERLARRAAEHDALVAQAKEEAANMPDLREQERTRMEQHFGKYGVEVKEIRADGHCLYAAVADQMETRGLGLKPRIQVKTQEEAKLPDYKRVRYAAADLIESHPDDFAGFMEEPLDVYLQKIRETGEWGGHMELMALARSYGVNINVLHSDGHVDKIEPGDDVKDEDDKEIWLGYYRHSHGLGEHYNSLRNVS
ncbi:cysteine proteinase [Paraphaeosphaeria sporulosa]|uniref:Cysteine proteinase n=1 Tax=Paraphaeosphaeria sporulosa TaxID=1460663 RepID=A0A177CY47_9PLEO|nr:cysteine proteinase [Paraphaeosphaeria sporulosa]OAG11812.1 cysteine proteinase [Paraphaeosphaeria sporulosa]